MLRRYLLRYASHLIALKQFLQLLSCGIVLIVFHWPICNSAVSRQCLYVRHVLTSKSKVIIQPTSVIQAGKRCLFYGL